MKLKSFKDLEPYKIIFNKDNNNREIKVFNIKNTTIVSDDVYYPNVLLYSNNVLIDPLDEKIMSLKDVGNYKNYSLEGSEDKQIVNPNPLFYFIYNFDNYYHFIYDTLPYLISYFELKKNVKNLKLLVSYPSKNKQEFYDFNLEFLSLIGINKNDIIISCKDTLYTDLYVSESFTHGVDSNLPPRNEIFDFYNNIVGNVNLDYETPKKIYVSRRSWVHGNKKNIGTDYTNRRRLTNEDDLIDYLTNNGFSEIFTENLTTKEKIHIFKNAEIVVGPIGGGLCNLLFSPSNTNLISIVSPTFLEVNYRFIHSFNNVNTYYFKDTEHIEIGRIKTNMRVKYKNIIGEVSNISDDYATIIYKDEFIAGWSSNDKFKEIKCLISDLSPIDDGLNSPWQINMNKFKKYYEERFTDIPSRIF
jgi:hypothetical protein